MIAYYDETITAKSSSKQELIRSMLNQHRNGEARKAQKMNAHTPKPSDKLAAKGIDWKQIGRFVSIIVKLFSHLTEIFKKQKVGPEILEWITGEGEDLFNREFLTPLAARYRGISDGFKSWSAICGIDDWCLRMALARVDIKSDVGLRLRTAFPECFTETEARGPVPLSVLQETARQNNITYRQDHNHPEEYLWQTEAVQDLNIPYIYGCWDKKLYENHGKERGWVLFEESFEPSEINKITEFRGQKYFVAEFMDDGAKSECCLVPVELIAIDK